MTTANLLYVKHPFAYINEDAIPNTITYITRFNDENIFFYGIWPPTKDSAIKLFEYLRSRSSSNNQYIQQLQHFWITFDSMDDLTFINSFANDVAFIFAPLFPICLATSPLTDKVWSTYLDRIRELALNRYNIHLNIMSKSTFFEQCDDILTINELAEALRIGSTQAYRLVRLQKIKAFKKGKDWKIPKDSIIQYISDQTTRY